MYGSESDGLVGETDECKGAIGEEIGAFVFKTPDICEVDSEPYVASVSPTLGATTRGVTAYVCGKAKPAACTSNDDVPVGRIGESGSAKVSEGANYERGCSHQNGWQMVRSQYHYRTQHLDLHLRGQWRIDQINGILRAPGYI